MDKNKSLKYKNKLVTDRYLWILIRHFLNQMFLIQQKIARLREGGKNNL